MFIEESIVEQATLNHDISLREIEEQLYSVTISNSERERLEKEYMRRLEAREMEVASVWS